MAQQEEIKMNLLNQEHSGSDLYAARQKELDDKFSKLDQFSKRAVELRSTEPVRYALDKDA